MSIEDFWLAAQNLEKGRSKRELEAVVRGDYEALQRAFWSNIRFAPSHPSQSSRISFILLSCFLGSYMPPMYGSDSVGSIFDPNQTVWNLNNLPNLLTLLEEEANMQKRERGEDVSERAEDAVLPGITRSMLYFGQWKSACLLFSHLRILHAYPFLISTCVTVLQALLHGTRKT